MDENVQTSALGALNTWLADHGVLEPSAIEDWNISPFEDALLFSSSGQRRSNRLYLVRGSAVVAFSPSMTTLDEAFARLRDSDA